MAVTMLEWKLGSRIGEQKKLMAKLTALELSLLSATVSIERLISEKLENVIQSFLVIRQRALNHGIDLHADFYMSKFLVTSLYRAPTRRVTVFLIEIILKLSERFRTIANYVVVELASKLTPSHPETMTAACYLILKVFATASSPQVRNDIKLLALAHMVKRCFNQLAPNPTTPQQRAAAGAALRVFRCLLTTPNKRDLSWQVHRSCLHEKY
eukprot:1322993-Amorphochlora_amoeboformis.AAC.3